MNTASTTYAIRVDGHLDEHWSAWLGGLVLVHEDDGTAGGQRPAPSSDRDEACP